MENTHDSRRKNEPGRTGLCNRGCCSNRFDYLGILADSEIYHPMSELSQTERLIIDAIGWTLTILALPFGAALVGLVIDGVAVPR